MRLALVILFAGCGPGGITVDAAIPDGSAPPDLLDGDALAAENAACEAAQIADFAAHPPSLGLASAASTASLSQIRLRNLLQHTGGWNRDTDGDPMFLSKTIAQALAEPGPASCEDTIRYMLDKPLRYTPGTTMCYSNFGYCVLGRVVEK